MEKLSCWICIEQGGCDYPICYEQEITERIKREKESQLDLFEGGESGRTDTETNGDS